MDKKIIDYNTEIIDALHKAIRYLVDVVGDYEKCEPYRKMLAMIYELEEKQKEEKQ